MSFHKPLQDVYLSVIESYCPGEPLSTEEVLKRNNRTKGIRSKVEWFEKNSGVKFRHWALEGQSTSDLAAESAKKLLKLNEWKIDRIILSTISGDFSSPPTAPILQEKLGLNGTSVLNMGAACAGFCAALFSGMAHFSLNQKDQLIVCADIRSKFLNPDDVMSSCLFGDASASVVLTGNQSLGRFKVLGLYEAADGKYADVVSVAAGGSSLPFIEDSSQYTIKMKDGGNLLVLAAMGMVNGSNYLLKSLGLSIGDIDWLIPHQGNVHLVENVGDLLGVEKEKLVVTVNQFGNTSGSSVGLALSELERSKELKKGQKILLTSSGGGGISSHTLIEVV